MKNKLELKINFIIMLYIITANIFPPMKLLPGNTIISIIFCMLWCISSFIICPKFFLKITVYRVITIIFIMYTLIVPYFYNNGIIGNRYINFSQIFIFYLAYLFYEKTNNMKLVWKLIKISYIYIYICVIKTFFALLKNPYIARSIKSDGEHSRELWLQCIGGYELVYMMVFISIIFFYIGFMIKLKKNKKLFIIIFIFNILFIIVSNYFTALIMVCSGIAVLILIKKKNRVLKLFFVIIFLLLNKFFMKEVLELILDFIPGGRTKERLTILYNSFIYDKRINNLAEERIKVNEISMKAFEKNPLLGIIIKKLEKKNGYLIGFGQHSQILDTFALFGIFIGIMQIYIISNPFFKFLKKTKEHKEICIILWFETILLFYNNIAVVSIGYIIYFVFPAILNKLYLNNNERGIFK